MRLALTVLLASACFPSFDVRDIERCDADDPTVDCCATDRQCVVFFGDAFPYCETPGASSGRCVECRVDEDCDLQSQCDADPEVGSFCAPIHRASRTARSAR
jgi:hypothetical protein